MTAGGSSPLETRIEPLASIHDRAAFSCAKNGELERYAREQMRQDVRKRAADAFVLVEVPYPTVICGFYTLTSAELRLVDVPPDIAKQLPRYPAVGATLLGRLAVDTRFETCEWIGGPCWSEVISYLLGDALMPKLIAGGDDLVWVELRTLYDRHLAETGA